MSKKSSQEDLRDSEIEIVQGGLIFQEAQDLDNVRKRPANRHASGADPVELISRGQS